MSDLTAAQKTTLKAAADAAAVTDQDLADAITAGTDAYVADWFNAAQADTAWRTAFKQSEMLAALNWTEYINRSPAERDALTAMFALGQVDCSNANVRAGFSNIFSGTGQSSIDQRAALVAAAKRTMTRAEKIVSSGPVSGVYTLNWEGEITAALASNIMRP